MQMCYNGRMGKLDEVKEVLNTLRVALSISFGILIVLIGSLVRRYDHALIDPIFWMGVVFVFVLLTVIAFIGSRIASKTQEIKDL